MLTRPDAPPAPLSPPFALSLMTFLGEPEMTTKQLRSDLVKTVAKIRSTQETLKSLRAEHTSLKARLTEARAAKKARGEAH